MVKSLLKVLKLHQSQYDSEVEIPESVLELRQSLVDEIICRPDHYGIPPNRTAKGRIKLLRLHGQPPSEAFLQTFANLFKLQVVGHYGLAHPVVFNPSTIQVKRVNESAGSSTVLGRSTL